MRLSCIRCMLTGKKLVTKLDHIGDDRYADAIITIAEGDALCEAHAKEYIRNKKRTRP